MEVEVAIYEDCLTLIEKFVESNNPSFISFCNQWKEFKFQYVYAAQTTIIETIQTTKTILHLAKRIACAADDLKKCTRGQIYRRIGGMFLMYSIYFKQPTKQFVKILMSNKTWQELSTFIESRPQDPAMDEARYVFWCLFKEDAFRFTALDYEDGLEKLADYDRSLRIHKGFKSQEIVRVKLEQKLASIEETEKLLPNMISLEKEYNKGKQTLISSDKSASNLQKTNIFQDIQEAISSIKTILEDKKDVEDLDTSASSNNEQGYDEKRKEIKRKAAGICDNPTNNEDSTLEKTTSAKKKRKPNIVSTIRKVINLKLPKDIADDLKASSEEEENNEECESFEFEISENGSEEDSNTNS